MPGDRASAGAVIRSAWTAAYKHLFEAEQILGVFTGEVRCSIPWAAQRVAEIGWWVAQRDGCTIGSAGLHLRRDGDAELSHLYVLPVQQGLGVGTALLNECREGARVQGCPGVRLWVLERTEAVAFYRRNNAIELGRATTRIGTHEEPTLCMRIRSWSLEPGA